ncbi:MAG: DHH family phosphoesterase [Candidatus ainarchaeum sp.]|nr:DHH family phosphoesterase [Candidatus ainarchaeum sp.]
MGFRNLGEGKRVEAECVVSSAKRGRDGTIYMLTDGEADVEMHSREFYKIGDAYFVGGTVEGGHGLFVLKPDRMERKQEAYASVLRKAEENSRVRHEKFLADGLMEKLRPRIELAAKKLIAAKKLGRSILLKFHNDADGVAGALALTKVLGNVQSHQQNSALYRVADAMRDVNVIRYERSPLVVIVDCGSGGESREGLQILKAGGAEVMLIDHHPPEKGVEAICPAFLSPWAVSEEEEASTYPAGYLCCEVARACGEGGMEELAKIACAGDKSGIMPVSDADREKALVIDYMATYAEFGNRLEFYEHAMGDKELYASILFQARERMERVKEEVGKMMKKRIEGPVAVYTVDFDKVSAREFPGKGKLTSRAFELVMHEGPVVVLGVWEGGISFRINEDAVLRGMNASSIIEAVKAKMGSFIESGGGHGRAASLRIKRGYTKEVLEEVVNQLQASQPQEKQALQPS